MMVLRVPLAVPTTVQEDQMTDKPNTADIRLGISLLFKPGQLIELRVETANTGWRGFYFDDHDRLAGVVARLDEDSRVVSLYYVINAVKPRLIRDRAEWPAGSGRAAKCWGNSGLRGLVRLL